ncbi:unnamed protein product, partial [Natator depressus]
RAGGSRQGCFLPRGFEMDWCLGSLTVFNKEDFEGEWVRVASGGFGQVYQVTRKRWRMVYAVKCSQCLLPDSSSD